VPSDSPDSAPRADQPRRGLHATEQTPGRPAPTDGSRLPIPGDPPASTLVRRPDRWREQASAPEPLVGPRTQPWTAWWAPREPRPCLAGHARSPSERPLPPGCGRRTPSLDTVSADQFLPRTPGIGLTGRRTWRTSRPSGRRTSPVQGDRLAYGYAPVRTATAKRRTPPAPSTRPCA
jgi:hypothetical protein